MASKEIIERVVSGKKAEDEEKKRLRQERREAMQERRRALKAREEAEDRAERISEHTRAMDKGNFPKKIEEQELTDSEPGTISDEATDRDIPKRRPKKSRRRAGSRAVSAKKIISIDTVDNFGGSFGRSGLEITDRLLGPNERMFSADAGGNVARRSAVTVGTSKFSRELTRIKSKISSKLHKQGNAKAKLIKKFVKRQVADKPTANAMTRFICEEEERYRREQEQYYDRILDELAVTMGKKDKDELDDHCSELSRVLAG